MKKIRNLLAMLLAVVMCMSMAAPAFAAETIADVEAQSAAEASTDPDDGIMPLATEWYSVGYGYTTVAYNPCGINGDVYIAIDQEGYNGLEYQWNMRMYDANGYIVWNGSNVTGIAAEGSWWAGANVTTVAMEIIPRFGGVTNRSFVVKVTY